MSNRLDVVRGIRDAVVSRPTVEEGCPEKGRLSKKPRFKKLRKQEVETEERQSFADWMQEVSEHVEEITGMDVEDILSDTPWKSFYKKGMAPSDAAEMAIQQAEEEEDTFDVPDYLDEEESPSLRRRQNRDASTLISSIREINDFFFESDSRDEEDFEEEYGTYEDEMEEEEEYPMEESAPMASPARGVSTPRRAKTASGLGSFPLPPGSQASPVTNNDQPRSPFDATSFTEGGMFAEPKGSIQEPKSQPRMPEMSEAALIADVSAHIAPQVAQERQEKASLKAEIERENQERWAKFQNKQEEDESAEDETMDEGVAGGDFGRWKPASSAASASGGGIAAALSKKHDTKYTIDADGTPASGEGGSELLYELEPKDESKPLYWLVIKIKQADKNSEPKWNVYLKTGKGLGSASTVASVSGVESGKLSSAISGLKGKIGG